MNQTKTPNTTPGHVSRAKDPAIVNESQSIVRVIGRVFWWTAIVLVILSLVSWVYARRQATERQAAAIAALTPEQIAAIAAARAAFAPPARTTAVAGAHPPIYATTPTVLTIDYGFNNIEADGPIMIQYPTEKPFLFIPGGCQKLPQPRQPGPKKFWDPKDPEGRPWNVNDPERGHIAFRVYAVPKACP